MKTQLRGPSFFKKLVIACFLMQGAQSFVKAQSPMLIQDINTGSANSNPTLLTYCGGLNCIFFVADNGSTGPELWKYDLTASNASLVKDINPGSTGSGITVMTFNLSGNGIIFNANNGTAGTELWVSDGTTAGTTMLMDINTGTASSSPANFYTFGGFVLFSADNGVNGKEVWMTNGMVSGTALLKDINPGIGASDPNNFTALGTKVLFRANNGTVGSELWSTDLTAANTLLVKDIFPGASPSVPQNFAVAGGTLFFSANDGTSGTEIWESDGTTTGTQLVKDINPGAASSINTTPGSKAFFTAFNNALYFQATDGAAGYELWVSNGVAAGTLLVKDIQSGAASSMPSGILATANNLFFTANDGVNGIEVWMSNGTSVGTALLSNINPGAGSAVTATTTFVQSGNGIIYFAANDGTNGTELWKTLGSSVTTTMVANINPGAGSSSPASMVITNNVAYFSATDGATGIEPWKFDPNPTSIKNIDNELSTLDLFPNPAGAVLNLKSKAMINEIMIFSANGQLVLSEKVRPGTNIGIETKGLNPGIYFVKVLSDKGEVTKKLVIQN